MGIGCCDLKILSLIMEELLNTFLVVAKSLVPQSDGVQEEVGYLRSNFGVIGDYQECL